MRDDSIRRLVVSTTASPPSTFFLVCIRRVYALIEHLGRRVLCLTSAFQEAQEFIYAVRARGAVGGHSRQLRAIVFAQPGGISPRRWIGDATELAVDLSSAFLIHWDFGLLGIREELQLLRRPRRSLWSNPLRGLRRDLQGRTRAVSSAKLTVERG